MSALNKDINKDKKDMYMEDVGKISCEAIECIMESLKKFNTRLSEKEIIDLIENDLYMKIFEKLEFICDNDYRQHN